MQKDMVGAVVTDYKILRAVIGFVFIDMMHFNAAWNWSTERPFGD